MVQNARPVRPPKQSWIGRFAETDLRGDWKPLSAYWISVKTNLFTSDGRTKVQLTKQTALPDGENTKSPSFNISAQDTEYLTIYALFTD